MKKFIYILFLSFAIFIGVDKVSAEANTCVYEFHGAVITVSEIDKKQAFFELDESNATKQWVDSNGKSVEDITYLSKLKQKEFFVAEKFTCISSFNALISKYKQTSGNWEKVEFSHSKPDCSGIWSNCDRYEVVELKQQLEKKNSCTYSFQKDDITAVLTVSYNGPGKVKFVNDDGSYSSKVKAQIKVKDEIFFNNGNFDCENAKVEYDYCKYGTSKSIIYWKAAGEESYCSGAALTDKEEGETLVDEVYQDDKTDSSHWNSTDGKTINFIKKIYSIIKILIPVLIVVLSIVDFLKVLLASDDKNFKSAWDKFIKRIIVGVIFFILPVIISFLINLSGISEEYQIFNIFT